MALKMRQAGARGAKTVPHEEIDAIRAMLAEKPRPVGWAERRARLDEVGAAWPVAEDISCEPVDCGGVPGEWSLAPGSDPARVLLFFHGGGYCAGSIASHRRMATEAGRAARMRTLAVGYRLAPEHPFPAGLEDARAALRWARAHAADFGADPERVSVGGDSAGGNLAAVVSQLEAAGGTPPVAQLLIYPVVDSANAHPSDALFGEGYFLDTRDREAFARWYTGETGHDRADPRVSPLLAPSLAGLPAALVVTVGFDILRDEGRTYSTRLLDAGTRVMTLHYPSLVHGFVNMTGISPAAHDAAVHVAAGFRMLLEGARSSGPRPVNL